MQVYVVMLYERCEGGHVKGVFSDPDKAEALAKELSAHWNPEGDPDPVTYAEVEQHDVVS